MGWVFKIFPSIGVARLGNCSDNSASGFYVGPEIPGTVIVPPNGYKDSSGQVRHQAARFRIYGWENGVFMGEITSSVANIAWTVELANTKAAFNAFAGIGHTGPLRNASVADRSSLMITPGPRTITGPMEPPSSTPVCSWESPCRSEKFKQTAAAVFSCSADSVPPVRPPTRRSRRLPTTTAGTMTFPTVR